MAIPIRLPNSDDVEDNYRSLDLLLEQLLITLRQVLLLRRREAAANAPLPPVRHRHVPSDRTPIQEISEQTEQEESTRVSTEEIAHSVHNPLPDVVLSGSSNIAVSQEQHKELERTNTVERPEPAQPHSWAQVGADLKRIADQMLATNRLDQKEDKKSKIKEKDASLLSLLCPPLGGSVWTTVAILLGWGLLSRSR